MSKTMDEPKSEKRGAYLLWGLATGFRYFFPSSDEERAPTIGLLIEWEPNAVARGVEAVESVGIRVPGVYRKGSSPKLWSRICTVGVEIRALERFFAAVEPHARRIELGTPIRAGDVQARSMGRRVSDAEVLVAVMDDGCAYANERFMTNNNTRVMWLWNQDPAAKGAPVDGSSGPPNTDFDGGAQWSNVELDNFLAAAGGIDEQAYRSAALPGLRRAAAHGTHVMDLLAGSEAQWDIVFVQFSQASVDDPSGVWLDREAVEGLHYILECAGPNTKKVVVNISWGPQTGPHDGTSLLESAIDELVTTQQAAGRELIVSIAAGNTYSADAHACIDYATGGNVEWIVPPDGTMPAFLEVRWPKTVAPSHARLRVVSPSGRVIVPVSPPPPPPPLPNVKETCSLTRPPGQGALVLLSVSPTEARDIAMRGEHGRWRLEFAQGTSGVGGEIHVYVGRADHNMGRRRRAKASRLVDASLAAARNAAPDQRAAEAPGSLIRRSGTLSGIATGASSHVAAGYTFAGFSSAPYSSSGGSRGARTWPDYACVTDYSAAVPGVRASGVRSGTTFRLVGTSTAAPQLGRQLGRLLPNEVLAEFLPYPTYLPERIGKACLWPDDGIVHKS